MKKSNRIISIFIGVFIISGFSLVLSKKNSLYEQRKEKVYSDLKAILKQCPQDKKIVGKAIDSFTRFAHEASETEKRLQGYNHVKAEQDARIKKVTAEKRTLQRDKQKLERDLARVRDDLDKNQGASSNLGKETSRLKRELREMTERAERAEGRVKNLETALQEAALEKQNDIANTPEQKVPEPGLDTGEIQNTQVARRELGQRRTDDQFINNILALDPLSSHNNSREMLLAQKELTPRGRMVRVF